MLSKDKDTLERGLENRHLQLIAIGGAIGSGFFMGSGQLLTIAGPSIIFIYGVIGFVLFLVIRAMGELLLSNLQYKSFIDFAEDMLGPIGGFFVGWTYLLSLIVAGIANIIAISSYFQFWLPDIESWIPAVVSIVVITVLNLAGIRLFGELEFWFSFIKIFALFALIGVGVYLVASGFISNEGYRSSPTNLWEYGGFFPHGIIGFFAGLHFAIFSFAGIEVVGITVAESKYPKKSIPQAINAIPIRIAFFYIFALVVAMSITPWTTYTARTNLFVHTFSLAGITSSATIVTFVGLTAAASSANIVIYSISRLLFGLSKNKSAPTFFAKLSNNSTPAYGILFSCLCLLLGSSVLLVFPSAMDAFTLISSFSATIFIFVWSIILICWLRYASTCPELRSKTKFALPGGKFSAWACLFFFAYLIVSLYFGEMTRRALFISPLWFLFLTWSYISTKSE